MRERGLEQGNRCCFKGFSSHNLNQENGYSMNRAREIQVIKLNTSVINLKVRHVGIHFVIDYMHSPYANTRRILTTNCLQKQM
jgi:hypothetical protein